MKIDKHDGSTQIFFNKNSYTQKTLETVLHDSSCRLQMPNQVGGESQGQQESTSMKKESTNMIDSRQDNSKVESQLLDSIYNPVPLVKQSTIDSNVGDCKLAVNQKLRDSQVGDSKNFVKQRTFESTVNESKMIGAMQRNPQSFFLDNSNQKTLDNPLLLDSNQKAASDSNQLLDSN